MEATGHRKLIVGLGNPGKDYEHTYHSAGALALDAIAMALAGGDPLQWEAHKKLFVYTKIGDWTLVKPLTFMNTSGSAVREAARKFTASPADIVIIHDDSDLPVGTWKISRARGAGGHHGVESIVATLGTNDFTRIRIGIRPAREVKRKKAEEFVLKPITKRDAHIFKDTFLAVAEELKKKMLA